MSLADKPLEKITETDLAALVENKVIERKALEYKETKPGNTDSDKKEFLADVSSFANVGGGLIFYGVKSVDGIPTELSGFDPSEIDAEKLRLENIIRDGLAPRVSNIHVHGIDLASGKTVIGLSIPRSYQAPHMVTFGNHAKFYARNSAGKYQLDVFELRDAFGLTQALSERVREFRLLRVGKIISGEMPMKLMEHPPIVLHTVPLISFDTKTQIDLPALESRTADIRPMEYRGGGFLTGWSHTYNLDGYLSYSSLEDKTVYAYLQIFRNGIFEAVDTISLHDEAKRIPYVEIEELIIDNVKRMIELQRGMGITAPFVVFVSLLGVRGFSIILDNIWKTTKGNIAEKDLMLPEIIIDNPDTDYSAALKPIFDMIWNASGFPRSLNYDDQGKRKT